MNRFPVFKNQNLVTLNIISFLDGCAIFHKVATLSTRYRIGLPDYALIDQTICITIKKELTEKGEFPPNDSLIYAVGIADIIWVQIHDGQQGYIAQIR